MGMNFFFSRIVARLLKVSLSELRTYFFHFLLKSKPHNKKVIIFSQGRSGSTLLESLLASTGYFIQRGEILGPEFPEVKNPYYYLSGLSKMNNNFLFHLKIYHLTRDRKEKVDPKKLLQKLYDSGWYIIFLDRQNKINQALSTRIAEYRGEYHKTTSRSEKFRLKIDCNLFKNEVRGRYLIKSQELEALSEVEYFQVLYERDLQNASNHQTTVNKILNYIGLKPKIASTKYQKINVYSPNEIIINHLEFNKKLEEMKKDISIWEDAISRQQ